MGKMCLENPLSTDSKMNIKMSMLTTLTGRRRAVGFQAPKVRSGVDHEDIVVRCKNFNFSKCNGTIGEKYGEE